MTRALLASVLLLAAAAYSAEDFYRAGLLALQQGDLAAAQTNLEAARKAAPRDGRVWVALSQTYWRLHKNADAEAAAGQAAALAPDDPVVLQALVIYYSETGQNLKAARAAAKYSPPRAADLYFAASRPLLEQQQFAEAIAILQESVARVPNNAQLELALGVACYALRRFDEAADAFLRTIDIAPDIDQPYQFLGRFLDQIPNRLPRVTEKLAAYQASHPASAPACLLYAKALDAQSLHPDLALELLQKSVSLDASSAAAHFELGTVLDRFQRFAEAVAAFERAAQLAPNDAATHYRLARDYDRVGKHDLAAAERTRHADLIKSQEPIR